MFKKKSEDGGDFRAIKPHQFGPENPGNRVSEALKLKFFRGRMPPDLLWELPPSAGVYLSPLSSNLGSAPGLTPDYLSSKFVERSSVSNYSLRDIEGKLAIPLPRKKLYEK